MKTLEDVSGIGVKSIELLHKLGVQTVSDLVCYYPRRYHILKRTDMRSVVDGDKVVLDGVVEGVPTVTQVSSTLKKVIFRISTSSNFYQVCVFNQVYLCRELRAGSSIVVVGKYDKKRNMITASEVRLGELPKAESIEPIYATTEGLNRKVLRKFIETALKEDIDMMDYIPQYLRIRYHFPEKLWSIRQIHYPNDMVSFKKARQRLKYEEFFWYLLRIQFLKNMIQEDVMALQKKFDEKSLESLIEGLPFSLTDDQLKTVLEIKNDLLSKKRMNRLVQGDVGSGKTIVAFLAGYMNFLAGYQTALMVPTEKYLQPNDT